MVRIVRTEDIQIIIDETGKKNGRGAYICKNAECMKKALKSRGLDRSFKIPVSKEVYENLALQMEDLYG